MLKSQRFSSLFRHYAKYHGLKKDDLEYSFCSLLENEDTPESVHLQRGDTILVRKKRKAQTKTTQDDEEYWNDLRDLLTDTEHMDCEFILQDQDEEKVYAHKALLTSRSEYFKALFRKDNNNFAQAPKVGGFKESISCSVPVPAPYRRQHVQFVLEFIYTNRLIQTLEEDDMLLLLTLADQWLLRDLKKLMETKLSQSLTVANVARLYGSSQDLSAPRLSEACVQFIMEHLRQLAGNPVFEEEMAKYPNLCIPILQAAARLLPDQPSKKQRLEMSTVENDP